MWDVLEPGDTAIIYASISRVCREKNWTPKDVLDSLLNKVSPDGTLLFPLFHFGWCHGESFDIRYTPSNNGILSETARMHPEAIRTTNPIVGFAVIGKHAEDFKRLDNIDGFGSGSPFELVAELDGKSVAVDLPEYMSMTHYHYIEWLHSAPYRFTKSFTSLYTDENGKTEQRTYDLFVRKKGVVTYIDLMGENLWAKGFYKGNRPGIGDGMRSIKVGDLIRNITVTIQSGRAKGLLYRERKPFDK